MKSFSCRDLGMDCEYNIRDESTYSLVQRAMAHHLKDHEGLIYEATDITTRDDLENKIKMVIKEIE
ncbi:MAG: DUF1059 domain-containing protein [Candidatus Buchananbacteria bacterium]|jgi:predicted small metal-binding protein